MHSLNATLLHGVRTCFVIAWFILLPAIVSAQWLNYRKEDFGLKGEVKELTVRTCDWGEGRAYRDTTIYTMYFDRQGRCTQKSSKYGTTTFYYTDTVVIEMQADVLGKETESIKYTYNSLGELVEQRPMFNNINTGNPYYEAIYTYDSYGKKTQVVWPRQGVYHDTSFCIYSYNNKQQLVKQEYYDLVKDDDKVAGIVNAGATNDLLFRRANLYRTTTFAYDGKGNKTAEVLKDTRKKTIYADETKSWYNPMGKLIKQENISIQNEDTFFYSKARKYNTKGNCVEQETKSHTIHLPETMRLEQYMEFDKADNWHRLEEHKNQLTDKLTLRNISYYTKL